jgi:hypothetical protein
VCSYCGDEFPIPANWELRNEHLYQVHKFGECNQAKKFFRADHFRQHLKHSHAGTCGNWTNMLENACKKNEHPPSPLISGRTRQIGPETEGTQESESISTNRTRFDMEILASSSELKKNQPSHRPQRFDAIISPRNINQNEKVIDTYNQKQGRHEVLDVPEVIEVPESSLFLGRPEMTKNVIPKSSSTIPESDERSEKSSEAALFDIASPDGSTSSGTLSESSNVTYSSSDSDDSCVDELSSSLSLEEQKRLLLGRLMRYFFAWFIPRSGVNSHGQDSNSGTNSGLSSARLQDFRSNAPSSQKSGSSGLKRSRGNNPQDVEEDDGEKEDGRKRKSVKIADEEKPLKFACPYYKHNPVRYQRWTSCPRPWLGHCTSSQVRFFFHTLLVILCNLIFSYN